MSGPSKPLQNVYYERKVATERPCYICKRFTTTVLATIDTRDFLYTCESHLSDRGFATLITPPTPATPPGPTQEDIRKVISDYKAREARKAGSREIDTKEGSEKDKDKQVDSTSNSPKPASPSPAASGAVSPTSTHRKYALHRQIFEMRQNDIRRKEQGVKAREVGKGLPQVPRGAF